MKVRLQIPFTVLAIVAMFATMLPQTIWECPMTGRIDVAAQVCRDMGMGPAKGEMPCAMPGGKCCKPLTLPPAPDDDDSRHPHVYASPGHAAVVAPVAAVPACYTHQVVLHAAQPLPLEPAAVRTYLARFNNSPPAWWPQYRPPSLAGRAPPIL